MLTSRIPLWHNESLVCNDCIISLIFELVNFIVKENHTKSIQNSGLNMCVCEFQGKMKDAMVWLALQEKSLQKMLKDSENETYCKKYEVSVTLIF